MRVLGILIACLVTGGLVACGSDPVPAPAAPAKSRQKAAVAPATPIQEAVAEPREDYRYDPTGKPDPFRSFVRMDDDLEEGITTPLERFDLSQLEVTAIIWKSDRPRALIRDPAGKAYIVSEGTPIGKNKGRIVSILDNAVLVKETYVDFSDRATTKEVELRLYQNQGG